MGCWSWVRSRAELTVTGVAGFIDFGGGSETYPAISRRPFRHEWLRKSPLLGWRRLGHHVGHC